MRKLMDIVGPILLTAFVIVAAYFALKQGRQSRGKSYEQRREEMYDHYEKRMEEFRTTEMKGSESSKEDSEANAEEN